MSYSKPSFKDKYHNFINGKFVAPIGGQYFDNTSPIDNTLIAQYPRSQKEDVELATIAAKKAFPDWSKTPKEKRSAILLKISELIEQNLDELAEAESIDNGKPLSLAKKVDIPRAAHNFRFFSSAIIQ